MILTAGGAPGVAGGAALAGTEARIIVGTSADATKRATSDREGCLRKVGFIVFLSSEGYGNEEMRTAFVGSVSRIRGGVVSPGTRVGHADRVGSSGKQSSGIE